MRVRVLGSGAGGGVPQWNCACENCSLARRDPKLVRTQDSLLVHGEPRHLVVNASPDILRQIQATPELWPREKRGTQIGAIVLTNGDLDHVLGLFSLRESQPLTVYATERVWRGLMEQNAIARTLARFDDQLSFRRLALGVATDVPEVGVTITAFAAPGKPPVHLPGDAQPEDNVALRIERGGKVVTVATALKDVRAVSLDGSDVVFLDGTFFSSDELVSQKLGVARAEDMAHQPLKVSLPVLEGLRGRRILTHVNNSNPILRESSEEGAWVERMGWEIAYDGMEMDA